MVIRMIKELRGRIEGLHENSNKEMKLKKDIETFKRTRNEEYTN